MPIIINGGSRRAGGWWSQHLQNAEKNERVEVLEFSGLAATDIDGAFAEMRALAQGTKCRNFFYQANINPRADESLTPAQRDESINTLERNLGFIGQPRFVVQHEKEGRKHWHVVWSRIDAERGVAISDSLTARVHERTSRALEIRFDLERGKSVLVPDRDFERPERRPKNYESFRAQESGIDPATVKADAQRAREHADNGQSFKAALEASGDYVLAPGDRRDFLIIDRAGDEHSLGRRLGMKAKELRTYMADLDPARLPGIEQAKAIQRERQREVERAAAIDRQAGQAMQEAREAAKGRTDNIRSEGERRHYDNLRKAEQRAEAERVFEAAANRTAEPAAPIFDRDAETRAADEKIIEAAISGAHKARQQHEPVAAVEQDRPAARGRYADFSTPAPPLSATPPERPLDPTVEKIRQALQASGTAEAFRTALEDRGLMLTCATPDEAQRSERVATFAKGVDRYARKLGEGELLVMDERGRLFGLNPRTTGDDVRVRNSGPSPAAAPWMEMKDGAAGLSDEHRASAQRSYDAWAAQKPELAARHDFADYVQYVQKRWTENERHHPGVRELDLGSIDRAGLLSVTAAKEAARETWKAERAAKREQEREPNWIEQRLADLAYQTGLNGATVQTNAEGQRVGRIEALADQFRPEAERQTEPERIFGRDAFAARLDDAGLAIVRVTEADVKALDALRRDEDMTRLAAETNNEHYRGHTYAALETGDLAAVSRSGDVYRINLDKAGAAQSYLPDVLPGVTDARERFAIERDQEGQLWTERRADIQASRQDYADRREDAAQHAQTVSDVQQVNDEVEAAIDAGSRTATRFFGGLAKTVEKVLGGVFEFFGGGEPKLTPQQARDQQRADTNEEVIHARATAQAERAKMEDQDWRIDEQNRARDISRTQNLPVTGDPEEERFRSIMLQSARDREREQGYERER